MPEGYRHLTFDGRCRIYATGKGGLSDGAIAGRPGRHPATISREIRRNGGGRGYRCRQAQGKATGCRSGASSVPGKLTEERRAKVVAKPGRAGARNRSRGVSGWRTPAWSAVSGYTTSYARTAGTEERLAGTCGGGERNRTGRAVATRAGVTSRAGGTSRSARKRAEAVGGAMTDLLKGPGARVHTITAYSGGEARGTRRWRRRWRPTSSSRRPTIRGSGA